MKKLFQARQGIDVPDHKGLTNNKKTVKGPGSEELVFPMTMHIGAPAEIIVDEGNHVKIGTLIGNATKTISANIHSSVSGQVIAVEERESFKGKATCIIIKNDFMYEEERLSLLDESISIDEFLERISEAGITGKGGAGFPTHVKLDPPENGHRYILINGAECEPYSTTDHRVMLENSQEILRTVSFMHHLFDVKKTIIAIEDNKSDVIRLYKDSISSHNMKHIEIHEVPSRYPQGEQGLLLKTILDLEVPEEDNASNVGLISSNVSTIKAIHDAVFMGIPLTERVVTVTGPTLKNPQNILTRIGTPVQDLIEFCGGFAHETDKMISGGPMMGQPFSDTTIPIEKDTTTLLFLPYDAEVRKNERPCIRCAKCIDACPVYLQPILISNAYRESRWDLCEVLKTETCVRCGCCTYICPSKIPLLEDISKAVKQLKEIKERDENK
ncbi:electron transport complex subunit RsxC [Anoxynatronum buryatiense]|uniref:Ion-translocating oxidoreductase complex subunit C n=1 Tax=Anoxynatronum buryatiense TaxID=489973 RepID=A0AA45WVG2_9CLOT|nr:electron transport complex subunit RsxC [Anoxynatronum buryatiense]SMP53775.1 electron transport complex protein RnfC [Anoxynatronum buryatiense]